MLPHARANSPMSDFCIHFSATRKPTLLGVVMRMTAPSTNWFMWLPVKITGPCSGIFCLPRTSIDEKNIDRMEWKNVYFKYCRYSIRRNGSQSRHNTASYLDHEVGQFFSVRRYDNHKNDDRHPTNNTRVQVKDTANNFNRTITTCKKCSVQRKLG